MISNSQTTTEPLQHFLQNFAFGGLSAALSKTITKPIENIRISLYCVAREIAETEFQAVARLYRDFGLSTFWKGNWTSIRRSSPVLAMNFSLKDAFKRCLGSYDSHTDFWKLLFRNLTAGAAAGTTSLVVFYPLDVARTNLANDIERSLTKTRLMSYMRQNYKKDGIRGLYKGFGTSVLGVAIYRAIYFGGYDTAKVNIYNEGKKPNIIIEYLLAQGVAIISQSASYPADTVRRRLLGRRGSQYTGVIDCIQKTYSEGGWRIFWRGAYKNMLTSIGPALTLVFYDEFQWMMNEKNLKKVEL